MDCLKGYIGITNDPAAESGLCLTSLPDISIVSLDKIDPIDSEDYKEMMGNVEMRTILKFRTLFTIEFNRCFRINKREIIECIICENKALLAVALLYLYAAELMFERISSSRINKYTTIDKIKAQKLRAEFEEIFQTELSVAIPGIDIEGSSCIDHHEEIEHSGLISVVTTLP
jgi:hypothetical protein